MRNRKSIAELQASGTWFTWSKAKRQKRHDEVNAEAQVALCVISRMEKIAESMSESDILSADAEAEMNRLNLGLDVLSRGANGPSS